MSDWITDRTPTENDADRSGHVLHSDAQDVFLYPWSFVREGEPWMPVPEPYQPPKPDTSLAASIERIEAWKSSYDYVGNGENAGIKCDNPNGPCACGAWHNFKRKPPEDWWTYHSKDCGTKYRGCSPDCPKDIYERTGEWRG